MPNILTIMIKTLIWPGELDMQTAYIVRLIRPEDVDRTFLVAEPAAGSLSLEDWRRFCSSLDDRFQVGHRGMLLAIAPSGVVRGVAIGGIHDHRTLGRIFDIPFFNAVSASDERGVLLSLVDHVRPLAAAAGCSSIRLWTMSDENWNRMGQAEQIARHDTGVHIMLQAADF